jgi:hypothetical protein
MLRDVLLHGLMVLLGYRMLWQCLRRHGLVRMLRCLRRLTIMCELARSRMLLLQIRVGIWIVHGWIRHVCEAILRRRGGMVMLLRPEI